MPEDKRKLAIGLGVAAAVGVGIYALTRPAKAAPPPPPPPGRANLYGIVSDAVIDKALSGVLVTLDSMEVYTNGGGYYAFIDLEPREYCLVFSKEGYETLVY